METKTNRISQLIQLSAVPALVGTLNPALRNYRYQWTSKEMDTDTAGQAALRGNEGSQLSGASPDFKWTQMLGFFSLSL